LAEAIEPARQELFRRKNRATGGTAALVRLREDVLRALRQRPLRPTRVGRRHSKLKKPDRR